VTIFLLNYTVFFLGHLRRSNRWMDFLSFSRFMAHTTCFRPRTVLLGDCDNIGIHLGVTSPKNSPKRGVNRQFQAKRVKCKSRDILQSTNTINVQFRWMLGPSNTSHGWSCITSPNPRWRTGAISKIEYTQ